MTTPAVERVKVLCDEIEARLDELGTLLRHVDVDLSHLEGWARLLVDPYATWEQIALFRVRLELQRCSAWANHILGQETV